MRATHLLVALYVLTVAASPCLGADTPCKPCAGLAVTSPSGLQSALSGTVPLTAEQPLYIRWTAEPGDATAAATAREIADAGAVPWIVLGFQTPPPLADHLEQLTAEIDAAAALAQDAPPSTRFQVGWSRGTIAAAIADYAFLLKRASVALKGAREEVPVITASLPADPTLLRALYAEDVAAYVDGVVLHDPSAEAFAASFSVLTNLDPGKPVVVDARPLPSPAERALAVAAADAARGAAVTLFDAPDGRLSKDDLAPFEVLAREFAGELAYDPYSNPEDPQTAWSFVRASDLGLRVIVDREAARESPWVTFPGSSLRDPVRIEMDGSEQRLSSQRSANGLRVSVDAPGPVAVLRLERASAGELGGFEQSIEVSGAWQMPVEEVLRRLQVTEDAQRRRLRHYEATYTQHLRFRPGRRLAVIETTFSGPFFFRQGQGFDWVWKDFFVQGVRWKGKIPELPLIQPAKVADRPLEITFDRSYRYRLRGTATVAGRDCWVVDFEPAAEPGQGRHLWRGTVWIDRTTYTRVRTRALELGLSGDVVSNEETQEYSPVDANGAPAPWSDVHAFVLPLRVVGQEVMSALNTAVQVEKESLLTGIRVNADGFSHRLDAAYASNETMLRDTSDGLRYLEKSDSGERVVQEGFDTSRWFGLGGVFYDKGLDYPVPLAGLNYFDSDFHGTGDQVNLFFAGVLVNADWADPSVLGSRWDAGARVFAFFLPLTQEPYRDGVKSPEESVDRRSSRLELLLGHPLGPYAKVALTYGISWDGFHRSNDTAPDFVVPKSTFAHSLGLRLTFTRAGWRLSASGEAARRSTWESWGLPDNAEYNDRQRRFGRWQASLAKSWWMGSFTKLGVQLEHLGGSNLDRFSKYDFSALSGSAVAGYQGGLVTAAEADAIHIDYGFNLGDMIHFGIRSDAAWATDRITGLDRELLAGLSLNGTVVGPWQTLVNFDVGVPIHGPADGVTVSVFFLKLLH